MLRDAFYDMGVHAYPEGGSTVSMLGLTAKKYGYDGDMRGEPCRSFID